MSQPFAMLFVEPYQVLYRGNQILMVKYDSYVECQMHIQYQMHMRSFINLFF
jgi:hypothetical protein